VCAYANNQWNLQAEMVDDLTKTSFRKALDAADGTVSVLDPGGKCFTRVWCCYEIYVSLDVAADRLKYDVRSLALTHMRARDARPEPSAVEAADGLCVPLPHLRSIPRYTRRVMTGPLVSPMGRQ